MNYEQSQENKKEDLFADTSAVFTDDYFETAFKNLDKLDKEYIENNLDLIRRFDGARSQKEASMLYKEALETNDKEKVREVYEFVKNSRQRN